MAPLPSALARCHAAGAGPTTVGIDISYLRTVLKTARAVWRLSVSDEPVRDARDTEAIRRYNQRLAADLRLDTTLLPLGDGVAFSVKRP